MNKFIKVLCLCMTIFMSLPAQAKDYQAVAFGVKSDGITLNTRSIQRAIDYIAEQGGGRLVFYVGRYLTGSIELKSNVTLVIQEGATLVASPSIYDQKGSPRKALIYAKGQQQVAITGKGVIEGNSTALMASAESQTQQGFLANDQQATPPTLISMANCQKVQINGIMLQNAACTPMVFSHCRNAKISDVTFVPSAHAKQLIEVNKCDNFVSTDILTYPY